MGEAKLGAKVRSLRRRENMTQIQLAERLSISPSYLNLIEHNRRPLSAQLLIKLAQMFHVDLQAFATESEDQLVADLHEAFGDPLFDAYELTSGDVRDFALNTPQVARAVLSLYRTFRSARDSAGSFQGALAEGFDREVHHTQLPSEEVVDFIQKQMNYFPELEEAADMLRRVAHLEHRDLASGLVEYLRSVHGVEVRWLKAALAGPVVRRYDPSSHTLALAESLSRSSRTFQMACQIAFLDHGDILDRASRDQTLTSDEARAMCRVALANYFAAAVMMPYLTFFESAQEVRYDLELLCHRFHASFEQVSHRLTTLRRAGHEGVPFHMVRIDLAGNISKRFSGSGFRFARFSGACALWNEHKCFLTPGVIRTQVSTMPDNTRYFGIARTVRDASLGYRGQDTPLAIGLGCELSHANKLIYSDAVNLEKSASNVPIGVACRMCERTQCEQRAFPSLLHPLRIDENVRGRSFYVSVDGGA